VEELVGGGEPAAPYPLQLDVTRPFHREALRDDDPERMFALAGQGAALVRELSAAELVATLVAETDDTVAGLDVGGGG
jgi:NAD(P)H-dependent flavin oxidoreductase YrpB (nitropropane dioxygenase family)